MKPDKPVKPAGNRPLKHLLRPPAKRANPSAPLTEQCGQCPTFLLQLPETCSTFIKYQAAIFSDRNQLDPQEEHAWVAAYLT